MTQAPQGQRDPGRPMSSLHLLPPDTWDSLAGDGGGDTRRSERDPPYTSEIKQGAH